MQVREPHDDTNTPPRAGRGWRARMRRWWRRDDGVAEGIDMLYAGLFLTMLFLFVCQIVVWWHARNILEQSAAEGARMAAAADGSCAEASPAATSIATRLGGAWVESLQVTCDGDSPGELVTVRVNASTPAFLLPGNLGVSAVATAPFEAGR